MIIKAIDSHLHADILIKNNPDFLSVYEKNSCGGISWCFVEEIKSFNEYETIWNDLKDLIYKFSTKIPFFYMVGIHPRSIPEDLVDQKELPLSIKDLLKKHLADPRCVGIGEIGIDTEEFFDREVKILRWQLEWCIENLPQNKKIGIHTPKNNKEKITEEILKLLEEYPELKSKILIEHTTPITWNWAFSEGYMCGVTLQRGKCTLKDLEEIIEKDSRSEENTILNSDSAYEISDYFLDFLNNSLFDESIRKKILLENSKNFFNLDF